MELFHILGENGLDKKKSQLMDLGDYIDNMDQQFGKVLKNCRESNSSLTRFRRRKSASLQ